ncbi:hypothetical protein [Polaribacter sp. L3A8]|uniref:hypothetical protein n=1 Tax=Polaribacter sp. L3A8 TaxID=2686361 RepID=UPI00131A7938|nr:hypothetical protein [Polaribacter sp. L3A8]
MKKKIFSIFLFFFVLQISGETNFTNTKSKIDYKLVKKKLVILDSSYRIKKQLHKDSKPEFSWSNIKKWFPVSDTIVQNRDLASASFTVIEEHDSWVDSFTNEDIKELPVGVKHIKNSIEYSIGITKAIITKDHTELTVFARVKLPQTDSNSQPIELFFGADNVKLSHQGGIVGDANLVLLGDLNIPFNAGKWLLTLKGGFNYTTGDIENKTYVTIGCEGVKKMGIQGVVEFSRDLVIPVETEGVKAGTVDESKTMVNKTIITENGTQVLQVPYRVKGEFNVTATGWNDILVPIDLQPFVLAQKRNNEDYKGNFQFAVNQAVLDFSDLRNDATVEFPDYYEENGLLLPNVDTWRGVYVNSVEVKMPAEFMTSGTISRGDNERVTFGAHHLIIDNYGVSGTFYGDNLFTLDEGRTNVSKAWAYSLDHIEVSLAASQLMGAAFDGRILLPISKKEGENNTPDNVGLRYDGLISEEEYSLTVSSDSIIDFNLWKAKGQLLPNSEIVLAVRDGQFRPKATLHGNISISANQSTEEEETTSTNTTEPKLVEFKGVEFQNLILQTESPVFAVDFMGYNGDVKVAGFPVSISNIGITSNETNADLHFDLALNLMGENNGFSAETSLAVKGVFEEEDYRQKWKFQGVELDAILIDADLNGFTLKGGLNIMNDDPEYGDGFSGNLTANFKGLGIEVGAKGIFGKTTFRYWQFEAMVDGLAVGTGILNLSGFSGGASYKMKRTDFSSSFSPTGIGYTPDETVGLGLKAMVIFNAVKDEVFKGRAGFEIAFNTNGGIDFLGFYGQGTFMNVDIPGLSNVNDLMTKLKANTVAKTKFLGVTNENVASTWVGQNLLDKAETDFPQTATDQMAISAKLGITYDFNNDVLHGELDASVNAPGGLITGGGNAVLHFAPDGFWYIYIGTPTSPISLSIGVGSLQVGTDGYFMVGSVLPSAPPPDPMVAQILGVDASELDYMRSENSQALIAQGGGFAFGSHLSINTGDLNFLIFYANFQAGAGFDVMLRDYGEAECSNTGDQVGINGWYANGQAYVYLQGELGIRIKLFFINKKIPIIQAGAAMLLQAKAPNPIWMRGYLGGHYNLLGGLIKGKFRFKLTIGEECIFEGASPLGGMKIITDVSPEDGTSDIDVFAIPQAAFSMKVGEPIIIPEDDGDKLYRIDLEEFVLLHNGQEVVGEKEWSNYNDRVSFVSSDILPPNEVYTVRVKVSFKERVNGIFKPIMIDGQPAIETEERTFTTGGAPNYIPLSNITYSYPVVDQKYFFEDEYDQGYIQLTRGQDYLFEDQEWESFVKFKKENDPPSSDIVFNYDTTDNKITYDLPNVYQESQYTMQVASRPKGSSNTSTSNSDNNPEEESSSSYDNTVAEVETIIRNNDAENLSKDGEIERLTYQFGTSKHKTFKKKINTINTQNYNWDIYYSDVIHLFTSIQDHEPFDVVELLGTNYTDNIALVGIEATLDDAYFTDDINPPLYSNYPFGGQYTFINRDDEILGTPPKFALPIISSYLNNLEYEINQNSLRTTFPFRYNLGLAYKHDWVDIRSQIVNNQTNGLIPSGSPILNFLDEDYLFMRYGFYKTTLKYKLPGGLNGTSAIYKFKNPNDFR